MNRQDLRNTYPFHHARSAKGVTMNRYPNHVEGTPYYLSFLVRSPLDVLSIRWEVDGHSGSTECTACVLRKSLQELESAGYTILDIVKA